MNNRLAAAILFVCLVPLLAAAEDVQLDDGYYCCTHGIDCVAAEAALVNYGEMESLVLVNKQLVRIPTRFIGGREHSMVCLHSAFVYLLQLTPLEQVLNIPNAVRCVFLAPQG